MANRRPQIRGAKPILKALSAGVPLKEALSDIYWNGVIATRDGGYFVHKNGDLSDKGAVKYEYYSEEKFQKIRSYFSAIIFLQERDIEEDCQWHGE